MSQGDVVDADEAGAMFADSLPAVAQKRARGFGGRGVAPFQSLTNPTSGLRESSPSRNSALTWRESLDKRARDRYGTPWLVPSMAWTSF